MSRTSAAHAAAVNPSHNAWTKFFDKHMRSGGGGGGDSDSTTARQRPRYGAAGLIAAAHGGSMQPRRTRSYRDLASEILSRSESSSRSAAADGAKTAAVSSESEYEDMLLRLRRMVLSEGVPNDDFQLPNSRSSARSLVWKLLLDVRAVDATAYLTLLARGPSDMHDKICNDTFRTLATDQQFKERVDEAALIRMLNAFVWRYRGGDAATAGNAQLSFSYVQGMNVLAAPFLYVMPSELEAFHCFCHFIERFCPTYVQPTLSGVHRGLQLLERCLQMADPALYNHLHSLNLKAELYAFPSVLTMSACTPPLRQVLQVWDYLLAFGMHLSIPCIVAQLLLIRDELIVSHQPMKILRQFPDLDARSIVGIATTLVRDMDDNLYDDLVHHMLEL